MSEPPRFLRNLTEDGRATWIFVLPSLILLCLFGLPLLAIIARAANSNFVAYALSEQALKALQLSLVTSTVTVGVTILFGTPLAYMLAA